MHKTFRKAPDIQRCGHVVAGLFLDSRVLVAIIVPSPLSLYCDASGNEREPLTVVGSVVASAEDWLAFISRWNDVLAQYGVEYFRASEFAHGRGQFKEGWKGNQSRRDAFSHSLIETLIPTVKRWSGIAVLQSEFEKADRDYKLHENYQPFALAAETCIDDAFKWRRLFTLTIYR